MAFSSIIATGIMVIVLIVTGYMIMATLNSAVDSATAAQATARDACEAQLYTSLSLSSPDPQATYLELNVTNDGDTTIDDLACMDVIVKPIEGGRVTGCRWFRYDDSMPVDIDNWYVVYQVKSTPGSDSSLGPGDVMRVRCTFSGTDAPAMGEVIVAAPGGTTGTMLFNGPVW